MNIIINEFWKWTLAPYLNIIKWREKKSVSSFVYCRHPHKNILICCHQFIPISFRFLFNRKAITQLTILQHELQKQRKSIKLKCLCGDELFEFWNWGKRWEIINFSLQIVLTFIKSFNPTHKEPKEGWVFFLY